jgi:hypothetical protein
MQFLKMKPPETQFTTCLGARAKRREVALGRPGFEPGCVRGWVRSSQAKDGRRRIKQDVYMHESHISEALLVSVANFWNPRRQHDVAMLLGHSMKILLFVNNTRGRHDSAQHEFAIPATIPVIPSEFETMISSSS